MEKVNIANYVINDLANRFNCAEHIDSDIVSAVAERWHKKHFISGAKTIKHHHKNIHSSSFLM